MLEFFLYVLYVVSAVITAVGLSYILLLHIFVLMDADLKKIKGG